MSALKTYDRVHDNLVPHDPKPWPFKHHDGCGDLSCDGPLKPGDWVQHASTGGKGMIVSIDEENLSVLWSEEPTNFRSFVAPLVRRVFPPALGPSLVSVQPMPIPSGLIFYQDYAYGEGSELDKKCNEGPWHVKMFWRSRRWVGSKKESMLKWFKLRFTRALPPARAPEPQVYHEPTSIVAFRESLKQWQR